MTLDIETFSNVKGGNSFFKALGHPAAQAGAQALIAGLAKGNGRRRVAIYDPLGLAHSFAQLHPLTGVSIGGVFVQDVDAIGRSVLGQTTQPVTELPASGATDVLVVAFDAERFIDHIRHLVPAGASIQSLDAMRLPDEMLTNPNAYLDPLNFTTNFAFFRETDGHHTRIVTANYWAGYGAGSVELWACLFNENGQKLAEWREPMPHGAAGAVPAKVIDSREVRQRFQLGPFTGQLFLHIIGGRGHDVVKYALDTYGDDARTLSCTHDANAWPADFYAGLPAPADGERVILWVQNSHPCPIPAGAVGVNPMGDDDAAVYLDTPVAPFGSHALDVGALLPDLKWPGQIEIRAGKHFVRPRYEILGDDGRQRIAHPNVQRTDLKPDPRLADLANLIGKGFVLPAPILPRDRFASIAQPTPMARTQKHLPLAVLFFDANGRELGRRSLGNVARRDSLCVQVEDTLRALGARMETDFGHMELVYDFSAGQEVDGWLHGLFRYLDRETGHVAETSFGAHVFNTVLTYKNEPQSYAGRAPGLSTRLFLRMGTQAVEGTTVDTLCHLIYPASTPWHPQSATELTLTGGAGQAVASRSVQIPCGGSLFWRVSEMFTPAQLAEAGPNAYVMIRDVTCRLFGYHGLIATPSEAGRNAEGAFSLDHMFGF